MYPSNENSPVVAKNQENQSYPEWNNFYQQQYGYAQNSDNFAYNYYNPMYNYSNYVQQSNYYNAFSNQPAQNVSTESTTKINEELIKIQNKVNEKLNYTPSLEKSENSSSSEAESNSDSNKENDENLENKEKIVNNYPSFFTTQKMANNSSKLSYTVYQLELLNAIYSDMKYPNSVQKTLIAKLIGITRDQVKIWFQNRRRKDTLVQQGKIPSSVVAKTQSLKRRKSGDEFEYNDEYSSPSSPDQNKKSVVENEVIDNVLYQLKIHQNAPSRLSTKRTKLSTVEQENVQGYSLKIPTKQSTENNPTRIIDISNIINKDQVNAGEKVNDYPSNPSSFVLTSSSSSSSSGVSSSEEEIYQAYQKPAKYQVVEQSFSIQDYVNTNYANSNAYQPLPKVHNQYQTPTMFNQVYPQYNQMNKVQQWTTQMPKYPAYHGVYTEQNKDTVYYENQTYDQSNQYVYNQTTNSQAYNQYNTNTLPYPYSS